MGENFILVGLGVLLGMGLSVALLPFIRQREMVVPATRDPAPTPAAPINLALLEEILLTLSDGVVVVNRQGLITYLNPAAADLGGEREKWWVGEPLRHLLRSNHLHETIAKVWEEDEPATITLEEYVPEFMVLRARLSSVAPPGREEAMVLLLEDQTELKHLQQVRLDFVHNASHELRTPIAHILGAVEILLSKKSHLPEPVQPFLDTLGSESRRLKNITEDLLTLARSEMNQANRQAFVDIGVVVQEVLRKRKPPAHLTVETELAPGPLMVSLTHESATQVVGNLVDNAFHYTPEGKVFIRLRNENGSAIFSVQDSGIGIPIVDQNRIFERFYRVESHRSRQTGGTGLGLSIVKNLVEKGGGQVDLQSQVGAGSTFTVSLPLIKGDG